MLIKASDRRGLEITGVSFQLIGLTVITLGFLIPASLSIQILIALTVVFAVAITEHIQNKMTFSLKEAEGHSWIDTLAFRLAINKAISSAQRGEYDLIDWEKVTREALDDADKLHEQISSSRVSDWLIAGLALPIVVVAYPLIGYGVALLIKTFIPGMGEGFP